MTELPSKPTRKITDDPYGAAILIRRLVMEQGFVYWRRYVTAFALMGVSAGATAGSAYILGQVINQAYIDKNVTGIAILVLENPNTLAAAYKISEGTEPSVANRLKMAKTSKVVAVVEAGGKLYSTSKEVKVTVGGCGG